MHVRTLKVSTRSPADQPAVRKTLNEDMITRLDGLLDERSLLSDWELGFITNLIHRLEDGPYKLSDKQNKMLRRVENRVRRRLASRADKPPTKIKKVKLDPEVQSHVREIISKVEAMKADLDAQFDETLTSLRALVDAPATAEPLRERKKPKIIDSVVVPF